MRSAKGLIGTEMFNPSALSTLTKPFVKPGKPRRKRKGMPGWMKDPIAEQVKRDGCLDKSSVMAAAEREYPGSVTK